MNKTELPKIDIHNFFVVQAYIASLLSHDAQTQCGAIIVNNKRVVSTGFNGFPRDIDDSDLPNVRPDKYPWMDHAETNAIANALFKIPENSIIYVTGRPCFQCIKAIWRHQIKTVYHGSQDIAMIRESDEEYHNYNMFVKKTGMNVVEIKQDFNILSKFYGSQISGALDNIGSYIT